MPDPAIPSRTSSTSLAPAGRDSDSTSRPRNRRVASNGNPASASASAPALSLSRSSPSPSRGASPIPSARIGAGTGRINTDTKVASGGRVNTGFGRGFLGTSWTQSWASVQEFASSLLVAGEGGPYDSESDAAGSRNGSRSRKPFGRNARPGVVAGGTWGPEPPAMDGGPRVEDIAAGSLAKRQAALKARRTASVLESHEGVNGGLDVTGKFKKRTSDEALRESALRQEAEEHLVYIHHVQPSDTYAGIVVKYKCREDAFRRANGLWSRDNIQVRKWLALPVDACEVRGRPCEGPSYYSQHVDLLAPTPDATEEQIHTTQQAQDDFFGYSRNSKSAEAAKAEEEEHPWTHVRWAKIDGFTKPVEIGRVSRKSLGYFPPRRKRSQHTVSTLSTPRGSVDLPSITLTPGANDSPASTSSRRQSLLSGRPQLSNVHSTASSSRSRVGSGGDDLRPVWMRRPGGVGSLGRNVRAPGPEKDYFNSWTKRHLPGLNIESLPSMSVMGSETARFGFAQEDNPPVGIVESPFEEGRDTVSTMGRGSGLDKAAATIETWLRGAFAKGPGTPVLGPRGRPAQDVGDLIELTDTNSDDGRGGAGGSRAFPESSLLSSVTFGSSGRSDGDGSARGRSRSSTTSKGQKAD